MKFTMETQDLIEVLRGCAQVAAKESMRKCMEYVHVSCDGANATFEACDGFSLIEYSADVKDAEPGETLVDGAAMARAIIGKDGDARVCVSDKGTTVSTDGGSVMLKHPLEECVRQYIETEKVWADAQDKTTGKVNIAFNAKFLSRIATLCQPGFSGGRSEPVRVEIPVNPLKPAIFRSKSDGISVRGMVLPVKTHD